ncbi:hypothetical protein ASPWEDRAFT_160383 [Aspergillus wentii DTO 134E9]|uniref:Rieske domain-containing protein n=1 Tax=Aspergillus wentii DTO 134E9 TaxID=1073089 RepID=A0A1L9RF51_ASPWE|nr:uncharacterized protein ASPWEDRAFT_160383 [Aspergillus wentii DTO 134E9]KAI9926214.1 hypothetical protein MW887_004677 [Aspergillus wentii]OJJ33540.1 hypothetical protein ASPWEDRAFT_160383 [Aspergillus wentii DTO 134E9]
MGDYQESVQAEPWHMVGLASAFPDISQDNERCHILPACKTMSIPRANGDGQSGNRFSNLSDQVLVFKYKGFLHAIDNQCPHSSFPLKQGNVFDIEDMGTPHGAGIRCFRHGWKFDLFSGQGDRGPHKLNLWDIELRQPSPSSAGDTPACTDQEVWVRRPPQTQK